MLKKTKKNNYKLIAGIFTLVIAVGIVGVFGTIQVGKAQQAKSEVAELTELANALGGNVEAFRAGLAYLSGVVTESFSIGGSGDNNLSSFTTLDMQTNGITIDGPAFFTDNASINGTFSSGGGLNSTSTVGNATLISDDLSDYSFIEVINMTDTSNITWTLPATSTMIGFLPEIGHSREWIFHNATTSDESETLIFAAGAGMDLTTASSSVSLTISKGGYGKVNCTRIPYIDAINENIMCVVINWFAAD